MGQPQKTAPLRFCEGGSKLAAEFCGSLQVFLHSLLPTIQGNVGQVCLLYHGISSLLLFVFWFL